jgi:lia operon protein LiaG
MIARSLLLLFAVAFVTLPVSAAAQSSRHILKGESVAIYNLVGELRVEPGSASDVVVEVQRGGPDAAKLEIQTGPLRGRETLRIIYPDDVIVMPDWGRGWNTTLRVRDDGTFGDDGEVSGHRRGGWTRDGHEVRITGRSRNGLEAFADLRVTVPAGKTISVNLGVGKAFVSNVDGNIRVSVASADVAADRTRGTLRIETGSGNVDLRTAAGEVTLSTGSGDLTVSGMQGASLRLETGSGNVTLTDGKATSLHVETGSGDIDATGSAGDEVSFETGSGNVDVALVSTFRSLSIQTGSGDVTLRVPATVGAEVDLDTGSGDIDLGGLTLQVRRIEHDHVTGTLGDGKGRLSVETGSGNVRLQKL